MTTMSRLASAFALTLFALALTTHAQTSSIEVSTDSEAAEFSTQGEARKVHVEVYAPSGELVFETADSGGQSLRWGMVNQRGERVPDGVYLATITVADASGKRRKRIEQIIVNSEAQKASSSTTVSPTSAA